jgi:hypothetical protein
VLDRLNRHDLSEEEWQRLRGCCLLIRRAAAVVRSPDGDQRDLLQRPRGLPVTGPAGGVRELEDGL